MGAIAPAQFLWNTDISRPERRQLWLWVHPAAYDEVLAVIESEMKSYENGTT